MLSNNINKQGKRYDGFMPYRLVINITKGDKKAELIQKLARGTVVGYQTAETALVAANDFVILAQNILSSNYGDNGKADFSSYGMVCVINEATGNISGVAHIGVDPQG